MTLSSSKRTELLDRLGMPATGQRLIQKAAKCSPVREIKSRGGNVLTYFQSKKMRRAIGTESRHLEFPAAVQHEYNTAVLEYFEQPCQLKFQGIDNEGEVHDIDHTPDFLIITERAIWFEEWKPWDKLASRAKKYPWKYTLDAEGRWSSPLIERWLAQSGIDYRIHTERDIPQQRVENILYLEDYLDPDAPPCPVNAVAQIKKALANEPVMPLAALYETASCRPQDVLKLIADQEIVADLDGAPLREPRRCRVFRDEAVRDFELARLAPATITSAPGGTISLKPNAVVQYDDNHYTVTLVGANHVVLQDKSGTTMELQLQTVEQLAERGSLIMMQEVASTHATKGLADRTQAEISKALLRQARLIHIDKPNRTERRHLQLIATAKLNGSDPLTALIPNYQARGNREQRLSADQESAIQEVISKEFLNHKAASYKHCHRVLQSLCGKLGIDAPSYPTLIARIKAISQKDADKVRYGNRKAYQNSEFVQVLYVDTPVHGSRAFQYVHLDHTLLDIELVSSRSGRPCGRPWLSIAIDAHTRRIVGIYLSFDPPSYRSNMMLLRDMVRRFKRLPQFIVVDNGSDFRSNDFDSICAVMHIHIRFRPAGRPRHGAIMERIFGRLHADYIHNLAGNTKALKAIRQSTGKFLPSRLAEWSLDCMYSGIEYWAFNYYDQHTHTTLGSSPREVYELSTKNAGVREHKIVTLTRDFLIFTCPTVDRLGQRKVDRQRGVKVHSNYYYWCPEFNSPKFAGKRVQVKYDPWDISTVYVRLDNRWVAAHCKALVQVAGLTEKERELFSDELRNHYRLNNRQEPTPQQLSEFLRTFSPSDIKRLQLERQREGRDLYAQLGIGAISGPTTSDYLSLQKAPATTVPFTNVAVPMPFAARTALSEPAPTSINEYTNLPDLDTF